MTKAIRVLLADDHVVVREGLRLVLESEEGFEVVGEASDGAEALRQAAKLEPDVLLLDLRMPGTDGLEALEKLKAQGSSLPVVVLTTFNEDEKMVRALRAGARAFLLKDTGRAPLMQAVRAAARGETLLSPEVLQRVLAAKDAPSAKEENALSAREREVLAAVAKGERNKEIAARLEISERTVKAHLANVFNKLGVDSRAAAVSIALRDGLVRLAPDD